MSKTPSRLRSQLEQVYHLTHQFQLQLQELESSPVPVDRAICQFAGLSLDGFAWDKHLFLRHAPRRISALNGASHRTYLLCSSRY